MEWNQPKYEKQPIREYGAKEANKRVQILTELHQLRGWLCEKCEKPNMADTLGFYDDDENHLAYDNCFLSCNEHDREHVKRISMKK